MKQGLLKAVLPHVLVILSFLVIVFFFYRPIFQGKELSQHDIMQSKGSVEELVTYQEEEGEVGLWVSAMFSGMPAYLVSIDYPGDLVKHVRMGYTFYLPRVPGLTFIMLLSFYLMMVSFRVRPLLAFLGAIGFAFSSFSIISIGAGHNLKIEALAYLPMVIAGLHLCFNRNIYIGGTVFALFLTFMVRTMHYQIIYYAIFVCGFYVVTIVIHKLFSGQGKELVKPAVLIVVALLLTVGANLGRIWSTLEYNPYSNRSDSELSLLQKQADGVSESTDAPDPDKAYAFRWSWGVFESFTLINPGLYGGASSTLLSEESGSATSRAIQAYRGNPEQYNQIRRFTSAYWGAQPGTAPFYAGALFILLFFIGLLYAPRQHVVWVCVVSAFFLFLAWGDNFKLFNYLVFDYLPGYRKFRAVTMAFGILAFSIPFLGILGLEQFLSEKSDKKDLLKFYIASGLSVFTILVVLIAGLGLDFYTEANESIAEQLRNDNFLKALISDRKSIYFGDGFRSLLFIIIGAAVIFVAKKEWLPSKYLIAGLALLGMIDMIGVSSRFISDSNYQKRYYSAAFRPTEADQAIMQDKTPGFRVLEWGNPWNDASTSYHHHSIGGYHASKLRRYQDFIELGLSPALEEIASRVRTGNTDLSGIDPVNMLNTKYIMFGDKSRDVLPNRAAFGPAWFVSSVKKVSSPDEEVMTTLSANLKTTAVIDASKFSADVSTGATGGTIAISDYGLNKVSYAVDAPQAGLAVFSEIYYPHGWLATIDGEEVDILRANFLLRALEVPEGKHEVVFEFKPDAYYTGNTVMLISTLVIILCSLLVAGLEIKKIAVA